MALQVWLPLTKDLRQQGLSDVILANNGATFNSAGKLGGCYYFNRTSLYNSNFTFNSNIYSLCYWVKYETIPSGANWYHVTLNGSTSGDYKFILGGYSSNGTTGVFRCNFNGDCGNIQLNTWYHVCATYDGAQCKIYINGELLNTFSFTTPNNSAKHLVINGRSNNEAGTLFNGVGAQHYLNDVRIYDHCLSSLEVKQISQGLILHYPLNRQEWGQENLVINSNSEQSGVNTYKFYTFGFNNNLSSGDTCIVSFDIKSTVNNVACDVYFRSSSGMVGTSTVLNGITTEYRRLSTVMTVPSGTYVSMAVRWNSNVSGANTSATYYIKNMKVEKGNKMTPWCPNPSDTLYTTMGLNGTTEYDYSGFCNNGERIGTLTYTSDTPKYSVSTVFNGTDSTIDCSTDFKVQASQELTFSCWVYSDNWSSGITNYYVSSQQTGGIILESSASSNKILAQVHAYTAEDLSTYAYKSASYAYDSLGITEVSGWHMLTGVYTTSNIKLYIDGELKKTTSATTYGIHYNMTAHMFLAAESAGATYSDLCNCKLSDFRIYATALSTEDVKSLYQNCATIDPDGTIRGQIR